VELKHAEIEIVAITGDWFESNQSGIETMGGMAVPTGNFRLNRTRVELKPDQRTCFRA